MTKLFVPLVCLAMFLTNVARADALPFFSTLRDEVANQLTIASNTPPLNKKLVTALRANLKVIDKTKPTLLNGSAALGVLAKGLGRIAPSNTFLPILIDTRNVYVDVMDAEITSLQNRLAMTIPGKVQTAAQTAIAKLSAALDDARTNGNLTLALRSLSTAAKSLTIAQKAVVKAETAPPGASFLNATITESNFGVTSFTAAKAFLDATYYPADGVINIFAGDLKKLSGNRARVRLLTLFAVVPEAGTYTFNLTNELSFATYDSGTYRNINAEEPDVEFEENFPTVDLLNDRYGNGTLNITVDLVAKVAWGNFTFTATGRTDSNLTVSITGSFLVKLEVDDELF